jgi:DNA-directed RNA polymerase sigma subunit (sigma70/sigma32)
MNALKSRTVRIRATLKLQNDKMLVKRKTLGLSQIALAQLASVKTALVSQLENLNFSSKDEVSFDQQVERVAFVLELDVTDIVPPELARQKLPNNFVSVKECAPACLQDSSCHQLELKEGVARAVNTLPERLQKVLSLTYGLNGGSVWRTSQIGRLLGVCDQRVNALHDRAIRKLQSPSRNKILRELIDP